LILIPFPLILSRASRHNPLYFFYSSKSLNKPTFLSIAMSRFLIQEAFHFKARLTVS
jgi:hypothetical protein